jgi:putative ABC transport system permease protein
MFKNMIKVAFRNIWKKKLFSLINIVGLSVGIACFFLIVVNVRHESSYDKFQKHGDRIYRVALERIYPEKVISYAVIPYSIGDAMMTDFPEVEKMTRVLDNQGVVMLGYKDKSYEEKDIFFVEQNFFEMFSISLIKGNPENIFATPNSIVMTEETALKYFGEKDPVGKFLTTPQGPALVSGVCENIPENSHMEFDFLVSLNLTGLQNRPNYVGFSVHTYVMLKEGVAPDEVEAKMPALVEQYAAGQIQAQTGLSFKEYVAAGNGYNYFFQPIRDIHLHSNLEGEIKANGNITYVYVLIAIAAFLIIIACVNFMNLATARSASRAREVGIRKIVGSTKSLLVRQFLFEALVTSLISVLVAATWIQLLLPVFNRLTQKQLEINYIQDPFNLVFILAIGLFVGLLAGLYPAFVLSSFRPVTILKGRFTTSRSGTRMRNALVVLQFAISIICIAMTILVYRQMDFMQKKDLGFDKENMVVIDRAYTLQNRGEAFKQELRNLPGVLNAAGSGTIFTGRGYFGIMFQAGGDPEPKTTRGINIDEDFIDTMGLEIIQGRGFSREFNETRSVIINESTIKEFGWNEPVGMKIQYLGGEGEPTGEYTIIGVVKDFHYNSLHSPINSFVLLGLPQDQRVLVNLQIKIKPDNIGETLGAIEQKWKEFNPQEQFSYYFLDSKLEEMYGNEKTSGQIFSLFSLLAIVIACIGLFGLSAYMAELRTKEIGIRKVLGSTASKIVVLLSKDFAKLVALAFVIATPIAYYAMTRWLQNFAFRSTVHVWIFLLAGMAAVLIAQLTISFQALKAANTDPADALRFE